MDVKKVALFAVNVGWNIIFDDEECEENSIVNIENFAEVNVPRMLDCQFKIHFRVNPQSFDNICLYLNEVSEGNVTRKEIPIDKQLMITIWYLANPECFRTISSRFNLERSSCFNILYRTCERLLMANVRNGIIKWPSEEQKQRTSDYLYRKVKFPGIFGFIDGCHIRIMPPRRFQSSYINRKGFHSVLLQGICNESRKFIDCYVGEAGSLHDATMLKRSPVYNKIISGDITIKEDMHLLGDSAYPLLPFLLTPYRNNGHLRSQQKKYNQILSKCRVNIENAFGLLKSRFRRLKLIENKKLNFIVLIIMSCCILHNICIDMNDEWEIDTAQLEPFEDVRNEHQQRSAHNKRDYICNSI